MQRLAWARSSYAYKACGGNKHPASATRRNPNLVCTGAVDAGVEVT